MDQSNAGNPTTEQYPVLRLANPLNHETHPNNNDSTYRHNNDNDFSKLTTTSNFRTTTTTTKSLFTTSTPKPSNVTNLTGIVTSSHPLSDIHSPTSPIQDYPDLIPEKRPSKYSSNKKRKGLKFAFRSEPDDTHTKGRKLLIPSEIKRDQSSSDSSDTEGEDISAYETEVNPDLQNVSLKMAEKPKHLPPVYRRRLSVGGIQDDSDDLSSPESCDLTTDFVEEEADVNERRGSEPIEEYSAKEEMNDCRFWQKIVLPTGEHRSIDMRVIEPYKRIFSHGGYLKAGGHNAIVVFSACFLPDKSRVDYDYVMDNLFLYVLATLNQLVTEDYVLVYLHGGAGKSGRLSFSWIKKCYQLVDRKLRKNLKKLYIVHPTIWVRTLLFLCKPFISSKFYKKINYIHTLTELQEQLPIEQASIPEKVKIYDKSCPC